MSFTLATKGRGVPVGESRATQGVLRKGGLFVVLKAVMGFIREKIERGFTVEKVTRIFRRESVRE